MIDIKKCAHLVGSIPLATSEDAFCTICDAFGGSIKRLPDGETGERSKWILYQRQMLVDHPTMELDLGIPKFIFKQWDGEIIREVSLLKFKDNTVFDTLVFPVGYADHAKASYKDFARLKQSGIIPQHIKFQVSLPTPFATAYNYISPKSRNKFLNVYEKSMRIDLDKLLLSIPHNELAVQWDVCQEVLIFEDYYPGRSVTYKQEIFDQLSRLAMLIPTDVELGFHICYGSPGNDHIVKPKDFAISVEIANGISSQISRTIEFIHMPGTFGYLDDSFFASLDDLRLPMECELYLGLLFPDDFEGNLQRTNAARKFVPDFGVATVCGWGRANTKLLPRLLDCHIVAFRAEFPPSS